MYLVQVLVLYYTCNLQHFRVFIKGLVVQVPVAIFKRSLSVFGYNRLVAAVAIILQLFTLLQVVIFGTTFFGK